MQTGDSAKGILARTEVEVGRCYAQHAMKIERVLNAESKELSDYWTGFAIPLTEWLQCGAISCEICTL